MDLYVDTSGITFLAGSSPEPVLDFESKEPKLDRETKRPLYAVRLNAYFKGRDGKDRTEILTVKTTDPTPIPPMTQVMVEGLLAIPWVNNGKNGVAYRAERIRPVQPAAKAS